MNEPLQLTQTRVGEGFGNCFQTCLACLLRCAIEEVPDPRVGPPFDLDPAKIAVQTGEGGWDWWETIVPWLARRGLGLVSYAGPLDPIVSDYYRRVEAGPVYWIAGGPNPDGVGHAVIYRDQDLWWDPNPSRRGLVSVEDHTLIIARPWLLPTRAP